MLILFGFHSRIRVERIMFGRERAANKKTKEVESKDIKTSGDL